MNLLIIPDSHAHPDYDNYRMSVLGDYILSTRPDVVVHIGDLADMPSISSYEVGTLASWGKSYNADTAAAVDHQEKLWAPVNEYNARRARNKKRQYTPRRVFCAGNHEDRADRFVNTHPMLNGLVDWRRDCQIDRFWDVVVPFKESIEIGGILFSHYFSTGLTGRPISGVNIAYTMATKLKRSAIQGHSHVLSYYRCPGPKAAIECWSVGCYAHPGYVEGWNRNSVQYWSYGILNLYDVDEGEAKGGFMWAPYHQF